MKKSPTGLREPSSRIELNEKKLSLVQNHVPSRRPLQTQMYPELSADPAPLTGQAGLYFFIINCFLFENAANHIDDDDDYLGRVPAAGTQLATIWRQPVKTKSRNGACIPQARALASVYLNSHSFITLMARHR